MTATTPRRPAGSDYLARIQRNRIVAVVGNLGLAARPHGDQPGYRLTFVATWDTTEYVLVTRPRPYCTDAGMPANVEQLGDYLRISVVGLWTPTQELRFVMVPGLLNSDPLTRVRPACVVTAIRNLDNSGFV